MTNFEELLVGFSIIGFIGLGVLWIIMKRDERSDQQKNSGN